MLVMTWNIGNGGIDPTTGADDRFWRQVELITRLEPDILCIQEAAHWHAQGSARLLVFEHATGLRCFLSPASSGFHTVVGVRAPVARPLKHRSPHDGMRHGSSWLTVESVNYSLPVTVVSAQLTESDGDTRLQEAAQLVDLAQRPCILAGDLNCVGFDDPPTDMTTIAPALQCRYSMPPTPGRNGTVGFDEPPIEDRRAVIRLLQAGFADTATRRADLTTPAPATTGYLEPRYRRRNDHLLLSAHLAPHMEPESYTVLDTEETRTLSPHLPVVAELSIA